MPKSNDIAVIELKDDKVVEKLLARLNLMHEVGLAYHQQQWADKHDMNMRQYLAFPRNEIKSKPYLGASNLFMPLTRVVIHGVLYREDDAFFNQDPYIAVRAVGRSSEPMSVQRQFSAKRLETYYQNQHRYVTPLRGIVRTSLKENAIDGTAVMHSRWNVEKVVQRIAAIEWAVRQRTESINVLGSDVATRSISREPYWKETNSIRELQQPALDNTNMANLYVPPGTGPSLQWPECAWYFIKRELTWETCTTLGQNGYQGVDDELHATVGEGDSEPRDRTVARAAGVAEGMVMPTTPLVHFYMRLPLPGTYETSEADIVQSWEDIDTGYAEEVIISVWWRTQRIAKITPLGRVIPPNAAGLHLRPHVDMRYHTIPRFFYGLGLAQMMRYLNKAINQYVNQGVDFGTLSNVPFFFYEPSVGVMPQIIGIQPGAGIPVSNAGGVKMPHFQTNPEFFERMGQMIQQWAQRDSSVTESTMGMHTDNYSVPPAARLQMALMNESDKAFAGLAAEPGSVIERYFDYNHLLHRKNAPEMIEFREAAGSGIKVSQIPGAAFRQEVEIRFVINPNRNAEQSNAMALTQFMMSIPYIGSQPRAVHALARNAWDKIGTPGSKPPFEEVWPEEIYKLQVQVADAQLKIQGAQAARMAMQLPPSPPEQGRPDNMMQFPGMAGIELPPIPEQPNDAAKDVQLSGAAA